MQRNNLLVLRLFVGEILPSAVQPALAMKRRFPDWYKDRILCKFAKFVSNHLLRYSDVDIVPPIVHLELEANEIRQYGGRAGLSPYGGHSLTGFRSHNWESVGRSAVNRKKGSWGAHTGRCWDLG